MQSIGIFKNKASYRFAQDERYLKAVDEKIAFIKEIEIKWKNKRVRFF